MSRRFSASAHEQATQDKGEVWEEGAARSMYAFVIIISSVRVLQYLRYYRSVGVLTIVIGHMGDDVNVGQGPCGRS